MASEGIQWSKILCLIAGCLAKFATGTILTFNVYTNAIKDTFSYTQKEVETMASIQNLGMGFVFVPGMFYERFGPRLTSTASLVISVISYMLLWSTTKHIQFYTNNAWLMAIYFFISGIGSSFPHLLSVKTNMTNFDRKHHGKILGGLNSCFAGSGSIFAAVYYRYFSGDDPSDFRNQNFAGFMLLFAIVFGAINLFCVFYLRIVVVDTNEQFTELKEDEVNKNDPHCGTHISQGNDSYQRLDEVESELVSNRPIKSGSDYGQASNSKHEAGNTGDVPRALKQILSRLDYQLFIWMFGLSTSVSLTFTVNITIISRSLHLEEYNSYLTITSPFANGINSFFIGFLSDFVILRISRFTIVLFAACISLVSLILVLVLADIFWLLTLTTTLAGLCLSTLWSISPAIMGELFPMENIGRNWGISIMLSALIAFGTNTMYGAMYDGQITETGETHCYGMNCIQGATGVLIGLNVVAIVFGLFLYAKAKH